MVQDPQIKNIEKALYRLYGRVASNLIWSIINKRNISHILSNIGHPLDFNSLVSLSQIALKVGNIKALISLGEMNPYALAYIFEKHYLSIKDLSSMDVIRLFYIIKDHISGAKRKVFKQLVQEIVLKKAIGIADKKTDFRGKLKKRIPYKIGLDFDLERTIDAGLDKIITDTLTKRDIFVIDKREKKTIGVVIVDVSGSMFGLKNFYASIISALVASALGERDLFSIIVFNEDTYVIKSLYEKKRITSIIDEILEIKPFGFTNISRALKYALKELSKAKTTMKKWALIVTDGDFNRGINPLFVAKKFRRLHVIQIPGSSWGKYTCKKMAEKRGHFIRVSNLSELINALKRVLRYPEK